MSETQIAKFDQSLVTNTGRLLPFTKYCEANGVAKGEKIDKAVKHSLRASYREQEALFNRQGKASVGALLTDDNICIAKMQKKELKSKTTYSVTFERKHASKTRAQEMAAKDAEIAELREKLEAMLKGS